MVGCPLCNNNRFSGLNGVLRSIAGNLPEPLIIDVVAGIFPVPCRLGGACLISVQRPDAQPVGIDHRFAVVVNFVELVAEIVGATRRFAPRIINFLKDQRTRFGQRYFNGVRRAVGNDVFIDEGAAVDNRKAQFQYFGAYRNGIDAGKDSGRYFTVRAGGFFDFAVVIVVDKFHLVGVGNGSAGRRSNLHRHGDFFHAVGFVAGC